jgi:hypothetical protein
MTIRKSREVEIAFAVLLLVGAATALVLGRHAQARLHEQNRLLERRIQQLARPGPRELPEWERAATDSTTSAEEDRELLKLRGEVGVLRREQSELAQLKTDNRRLRRSLIEKICRGDIRLGLEKVAPYLEAKRRNAASLLAAWRVTGEQALLREAVDKYSNDPRVSFAAYLASWSTEPISPDERRLLLDAFTQSAPDNALASYLSANAYFEGSQSDRAVQELARIPSGAKLQDFWGEFVQSTEEAYLAADFSASEANLLAVYGRQSSPWDQLEDLGGHLAEFATRRHLAGDDASARAMLEVGMALAQRVSDDPGGHPLVRDLVGVYIESRVLAVRGLLSPGSDPGQTVRDRLDDLAERRRIIIAFTQEDRLSMLQGLPDPDQLEFFARIRSSGEADALRWLKGRTEP